MAQTATVSSTAIVRPKGEKIADLKGLFESRKGAISAILPRHLTTERITKIALAAVSRNPDLLACTTASIFLGVLQAAELGLELGGTLGHAYLVPFNNKNTRQREAQFIPGYRGLISLARRSGEIQSIEAVLVYERDRFTLVRGLPETRIEHEPCLDGDPGKIRLVYGIARFKGGGYQVEVMTASEVEAVRARSHAGQSGPWVTDPGEMYRKTLIRRLWKYCPMSVEMAKASASIDAAETGDTADMGDLFDTSQIVESPVAELPAAPVEALKDKLKSKIVESPVAELPAAPVEALKDKLKSKAAAPAVAEVPAQREPGDDA